MSTTPATTRASAPDLPRPFNDNHDDSGRAAVFIDFCPGDAKALDQGDFVDRLPHERPRHVGDIAKALARIIHADPDFRLASVA